MEMLKKTLLNYIKRKFYEGEKVSEKGDGLAIADIEFNFEIMHEIGSKEGSISFKSPTSGLIISYFIPRDIFNECYGFLIDIAKSQEYTKIIDDISKLK